MIMIKKERKQMNELKAKSVVKDKFWIVEKDGNKIATIQAVEEGGYVYVHEDRRQKFPTVNLLKKSLNIRFDRATKRNSSAIAREVHGYPCSHSAYNILWDVPHGIPIYTKTKQSKSFFCAGYYLIKFTNSWTKAYCPKLITLQRYEFRGPFRSVQEQQQHMRNIDG